MWTLIEGNIGIICACLSALRKPLLAIRPESHQRKDSVAKLLRSSSWGARAVTAIDKAYQPRHRSLTLEDPPRSSREPGLSERDDSFSLPNLDNDDDVSVISTRLGILANRSIGHNIVKHNHNCYVALRFHHAGGA